MTKPRRLAMDGVTRHSKSSSIWLRQSQGVVNAKKLNLPALTASLIGNGQCGNVVMFMELHNNTAAYIGAPGFLAHLKEELLRRLQDQEAPLIEHPILESLGIFLSPDLDPSPAWAQNVWRQVSVVNFDSINDGAKKLRALGGAHTQWSYWATSWHRRAALINDNVNSWDPSTTWPFPPTYCHITERKKHGAWMLLDPNTMLVSLETRVPWPNGMIQFAENKATPPNRAYLKLWEVFSWLIKTPPHEAKVADLGASPGGWTWVLADQLKCHVTAVDKAPLDPRVSALPRVRFVQESAFAFRPAERLDWMFCDIICYPERLWDLICLWRENNWAESYCCTVKLQGPSDFEVLEKFISVPGSRLVHLSHNKHELTWVLAKDTFV